MNQVAQSKLNKIPPTRESSTKLTYNYVGKSLDVSIQKDNSSNKVKVWGFTNDNQNSNENSIKTKILEGINKQKELKLLTSEESRIKSQIFSKLFVTSGEDLDFKERFGFNPDLMNKVIGSNSRFEHNSKRRDSEIKFNSKTIKNKFKNQSNLNSSLQNDSFARDFKLKREELKKKKNCNISYGQRFKSVDFRKKQNNDNIISSNCSDFSSDSFCNIESMNYESNNNFKNASQSEQAINNDNFNNVFTSQNTIKFKCVPKFPSSTKFFNKNAPSKFQSVKFAIEEKKESEKIQEKEFIETIVTSESLNKTISMDKLNQKQEIKINNSQHNLLDQSHKNIEICKTIKSRADGKCKSMRIDTKNTVQFLTNYKSTFKTEKINEITQNENEIEIENLREEIRENININNLKLQKSNSKSQRNIGDFESDEEEEQIKLSETNKEENRKISKRALIYDSFSDAEDEDLLNQNINIHPESPMRFYVDFLVVMCAIYSMLMSPLTLAFNSSQTMESKNSHFWGELFVDLVYTYDFVSGFYSSFFNFEERLITSHKKMILNYLNNYMFLDFLTAMPIHTIFFALKENILFNSQINNFSFLYENSELKFTRLFILLRYLKLFKIFSFNKFLDYFSSDDFDLIKLSATASRLLLFGCYFLIVTHLLACMWIYLGRFDNPNWIFYLGLQDFPDEELYITSCYFILTTIFTIGYGDICAKNIYERFFNCILLIVGILIYSFAVTSLSNIIQFVNAPTRIYLDKLEQLRELRTQFTIPQKVSEKIENYLSYELNHYKGDKNKFLGELPKSLKNELISKMYRPIIDNFIFFKNFDDVDFIIQIIMTLKPVKSTKNERIVKEGDFIEEIIFIKRGVLALELGIKVVAVDEDVDDLIKHKYKFQDTINNRASNNNLDFLLKQGINDQLTETEKAAEANNLNSFWDDDDEGDKLLKNMPVFNYVQTQYLKVIELRKNEHYGDVLCFLNRKSPLSVRVKSRHAELFLMKKTDLMKISMEFPSIFEEVMRKSAHNQKRLDKFIKKTKDIFFANHRDSFIINDEGLYSSKIITPNKTKILNTKTKNSNIKLLSKNFTITPQTSPPKYEIDLKKNSMNSNSSGSTTQEIFMEGTVLEKNCLVITENDQESQRSVMDSHQYSKLYQSVNNNSKILKNFENKSKRKNSLFSKKSLNSNKKVANTVENKSERKISIFKKESLHSKEESVKIVEMKSNRKNSLFSRKSVNSNKKFSNSVENKSERKNSIFKKETLHSKEESVKIVEIKTNRKDSLFKINSHRSKSGSVHLNESCRLLVPTRRKNSIKKKPRFSKNNIALPISTKLKSIKNNKLSYEYISDEEKACLRKSAYKKSYVFNDNESQLFNIERINAENVNENIKIVNNLNINCITPNILKINSSLENTNFSQITLQKLKQNKTKCSQSSSRYRDSSSSLKKYEISENDLLNNKINNSSKVLTKRMYIEDQYQPNIPTQIINNINIINNFDNNFEHVEKSNNNYDDLNSINKCANCNSIVIPESEKEHLVSDPKTSNFYNKKTMKNINIYQNAKKSVTLNNMQISTDSLFSLLSSNDSIKKHEKKFKTYEPFPHKNISEFIKLNKINENPHLKKETSVDSSEIELPKRSESSSASSEEQKNGNSSKFSKLSLQTKELPILTKIHNNINIEKRNPQQLEKKSTTNINQKMSTYLDKNNFFKQNTQLNKFVPLMVQRKTTNNNIKENALHRYIDSKDSSLYKPENSPNNPKFSRQSTKSILLTPNKYHQSTKFILNSPMKTRSPNMISQFTTSLSPKKHFSRLDVRNKKKSDKFINLINKNIEKNSLNLIDPQSFYSQFFNSVINKNYKSKDISDQENLNKRLEFLEKLLPNFN